MTQEGGEKRHFPQCCSQSDGLFSSKVVFKIFQQCSSLSVFRDKTVEQYVLINYQYHQRTIFFKAFKTLSYNVEIREYTAERQ